MSMIRQDNLNVNPGRHQGGGRVCLSRRGGLPAHQNPQVQTRAPGLGVGNTRLLRDVVRGNSGQSIRQQ